MNNILINSKKCRVCDNVFYKKRSYSRKYWITRQFCSRSCSDKDRIGKNFSPDSQFKKGRVYTEHERALLKGHIPWNKDLKGIHLSISSEFKVGQKGYWSGKERPKGENASAWKPKILKPCSYCQKDLSLSPNQVRDKNFCDRKCWALGTRGWLSPVFKGEEATTHVRNRIRDIAEYREWHAKVLRRDKWRCVLCNSRELLEVDHIKRFHFIVIENQIKTIEDARNCPELWDITNGRTLCRKCHRASDTYGTTGLKKHQL